MMINTRNRAIEARTKDFLDGVNSSGDPPIYKLTPEAARKVLEDVQSGTVADPEVTESELTIVGPYGKELKIFLFKPAARASKNSNNGNKEHKKALPVILYCHGAGWVMGSKNTHRRLVQELAAGADACLAFVEYSRSPEAKFPLAIEECDSALNYLLSEGEKLGLNPHKLALAGDSVGGNMAIALANLCAQKKNVAPLLQVLFYPVTDFGFETGSYKEFAEGHFLTKEAMKWFWEQYLPSESEGSSAMASPLKMEMTRLQAMPKTLLITAECDVLRDEGEAFAARLIEAGVDVTAMRMLGTIHDFVMLSPLAKTPATRCAIAVATAMLKEALH